MNLIVRERPRRRCGRRSVEQRGMHIAEALHFGDRHPLLDKRLLRIHDLVCLDMAELLDEILTYGFQVLAAREPLDESAQAPLPCLPIVADHRKTVFLKRRNDLIEVDALDRRTARDRHDAPHHIERHIARNLAEPNIRHDLPNLGILSDQIGDRLFQIQDLFHRQTPYIISCYESKLCAHYSAAFRKRL